MAVPPRPPWPHPADPVVTVRTGTRTRLQGLPDAEEDVGKEEVPFPSLLVYHLAQHPLKHLVEAFDKLGVSQVHYGLGLGTEHHQQIIVLTSALGAIVEYPALD